MADTSIASVEIHGHCARGFEPVRQAFAANFTSPGEVGASVSVVQRGEVVVDLWAGHADAARTKSWSHDSLANVWSTTKGMGALVGGLLIERGLMGYAERVSKYWPEFAANGKERITIGQMFSHQAGLCGPTEPSTVEDMCNQPLMAARLAAQAPLWEPGSRSGYHALTVGVLIGELVKRITGKSIGTFFNEEIAMPFGIDFFIGLPELEEARVAEMVPALNASPLAAGDLNPSQVAAFRNPAPDAAVPNQRFWRAAELSSANGQGTATALARVYGALANGGKLDGKSLVTPSTIRAMTAQQISGMDEVLAMPVRWGAGYLLNVMGLYGPNEAAFGHSGWGGSFGMADPKAGLGISYVMNQMGPDLAGDVRANALIAATYASL
ncbi:MAG: serine hydrolase domain-containing protein [Parvibaculum sp.]